MSRLNWRSATEKSAAKWDRLAALARREDAEGMRAELLEPCGMCEMARSEIEALGVPKVELHQCDYCRGYLDFGGCQDSLNAVLAALAAGDWERARGEVERVRRFLSELLAAPTA